LMLVGDAGQLPSVQAGAVFHDLSATDETSGDPSDTSFDALDDRRVVLEESHRTSNPEIIDVAEAVRAGEATVAGLEEEGVLRRLSGLNEVGTTSEVGLVELPGESSGDDDRLDAAIESWWNAYYAFLTPDSEEDSEKPTYRREDYFEHADDGGFTSDAETELGELFTAMASVQLLTVTRHRSRGARPINRKMHQEYGNRHDLDDANWFERGEPVIITENDYEEGVFNGEQG
ncbi:MAG: hypothetical protein ABEN55_03275, partial [Bradymonadaceae bacterium]